MSAVNLERDTCNLPIPNDDEPLRPPRRKELRQGFSTGTAAAAAAQGALYELLGRPCPERVEVPLPGGGSLTVPLHRHGRNGDTGEAVVIKDAGDDPDVTNGAEIGARVWRLESPGPAEEITFMGGAGRGPGDQAGSGGGGGRARHQPGAPQDDQKGPAAGVG